MGGDRDFKFIGRLIVAHGQTIIPDRGLGRSRELFKFWWVPIISPELLKLSSTSIWAWSGSRDVFLILGFRGFGVLIPTILPFSIGIAGRPYNSVSTRPSALRCYTVIISACRWVDLSVINATLCHPLQRCVSTVCHWKLSDGSWKPISPANGNHHLPHCAVEVLLWFWLRWLHDLLTLLRQ